MNMLAPDETPLIAAGRAGTLAASECTPADAPDASGSRPRVVSPRILPPFEEP